MSVMGRFWGWLLPGLICLSPMGALAFYSVDSQNEAPHRESKRFGGRAEAFNAPKRTAVIPLARL